MIEKAVIFLLFSLVLTKSTYAYIDPGTGSMLIQVVVAFLLTGVFTVKVWLKSVKNLFTKKTKDTINHDEQQNPK